MVLLTRRRCRARRRDETDDADRAAGAAANRLRWEKGIIDRDGYQLDTRHPAQAAYPRIKVLVIHYTADNFDVSLATLTDKEVSSHYLIPEQPPRYQHKPRIWQLVPEEDLAWHAGVSYWRGSTRINDTSIGIELERPRLAEDGGRQKFYPFHPEQIAALIRWRAISSPATTSRRRMWSPMRISPRSAKTIRGRYSRQQLAQQGSAPGLTSSGWPFISTGGRPASQWTPKSYWICSRAMAIR